MKSMTGYGRGECARDGFKVTVEISSVNRRQSEISVYLPRELEALESRMRDEVNRRIARGRLTVKVSLHAADDGVGGRVNINAALANAYARERTHQSYNHNFSTRMTLVYISTTP